MCWYGFNVKQFITISNYSFTTRIFTRAPPLTIYMLPLGQIIHSYANYTPQSQHQTIQPAPLSVACHWTSLNLIKLNSDKIEPKTEHCSGKLSTAPEYPIHGTAELQSSAFDSSLLFTPNTQLQTFWDRAYNVATLTMLNSLPSPICNASSMDTFKKTGITCSPRPMTRANSDYTLSIHLSLSSAKSFLISDFRSCFLLIINCHFFPCALSNATHPCISWKALYKTMILLLLLLLLFLNTPLNNHYF